MLIKELKPLIDYIHEEEAADVYDIIGYLNMKGERKAINKFDLDLLTGDKELIRQVSESLVN